MDHLVEPARRPLSGSRAVPPSKSFHQRALAMAALADERPVLELGGDGPLGDDVRHLERALDTLGTWQEGALGRDRDRKTVDLGLGGTGFRFALALATLRPGGARTLVRGHRSLLARPHTQLRRALTRLGGHLKRRSSGAVRVRGGGIEGGRRLSMRADVSSQYVSALLLIAPRIGGLELELLQRPVSRPYLELTMAVLSSFGIAVEQEGLDRPRGRIKVAAGVPHTAHYRVEADASSAAPWWLAAVLTGGEIEVPGVPADTAQADGRLLPVLERAGAEVRPDARTGAVRVRGPSGGADALHALGGDVDLRDASDLLPLVGVLAAAAPGTTRIRGAGHARFKESDRPATIAAGIRALGGRASVTDEGDLVVDGGRRLEGGVVEAAGDHRLVLGFGVLGLVVPGVRIRGADAVSKSYPGFLAELEDATGGIVGESHGER